MKVAIDYRQTTIHVVEATCPDCYGNDFTEEIHRGVKYYRCNNPDCRVTGVWSAAALQEHTERQSLQSLRSIYGNEDVIFP